MIIEQKISPEEKVIRDKKNKENKNKKFAKWVLLEKTTYSLDRIYHKMSECKIEWSDCGAVYSWLYYIIEKNLHKNK